MTDTAHIKGTSRPFTTQPGWLVSLIVVGGFLLTNYVLRPNIKGWLGFPDDITMLQSTFLRLVIMVLVPALMTTLVVGWRDVLRVWGFHRWPWRGLGFAALCTLPLPLTYVFAYPLSDVDTMAGRIMNYAVIPGTAEEIWFRCFLFGLLFRLANWGFLPAALLGAVLFGSGHLYQSDEWLNAATIFAITGIAGIWWAWVYVEWDFDPWVPIGFHMLMNGCFVIFSVSDSAMLPLIGEIARASVVILSVVLTVAIARRQGGRAITGRRWL